MSIVVSIFASIGIVATIWCIVVAFVAIEDRCKSSEERKVVDPEIYDDLQERLEQLEAVYEPEEPYALDKLREKVYDHDHDLNGVSGLKFQITFLENRFNSLSGFVHQVIYGKCHNLVEDFTFTKYTYDKRFEWIFENVLTQEQKDKYNKEFGKNLDELNEIIDKNGYKERE